MVYSSLKSAILFEKLFIWRKHDERQKIIYISLQYSRPVYILLALHRCMCVCNETDIKTNELRKISRNTFGKFENSSLEYTLSLLLRSVVNEWNKIQRTNFYIYPLNVYKNYPGQHPYFFGCIDGVCVL
jgi:hypothetical protein